MCRPLSGASPGVCADSETAANPIAAVSSSGKTFFTFFALISSLLMVVKQGRETVPLYPYDAANSAPSCDYG
jgi:hypothetical protein